MDLDGLERIAADPRARMLYLRNPHNPVGRVWRRDELQALAAICRRHDVLVVSDEIHADITFPGHPHTPLTSLSGGDASNSIICISQAKRFNIASCCSAFTIISDEARREVFQAENNRLTVNKNNAFAGVAVEAVYRGGGPWLDAALGYIGNNLSLMREHPAALPEISLVEPEGTFLLWLDCRYLGLSPDRLTTFLRKPAGWAVTRGSPSGEQEIGFARLNISCTRARLDAAPGRLGQAIASTRGARRDSADSDARVP